MSTDPTGTPIDAGRVRGETGRSGCRRRADRAFVHSLMRANHRSRARWRAGSRPRIAASTVSTRPVRVRALGVAVRAIAIVGSGPAGVYCAEALLRFAPDSRIDIIDRLPTPFGLVRSGVAPDHQATKGVARMLDRVLAKPDVAFYGGVELGRDLDLGELRAAYDVVVLATGAGVDRALGIAGETLPGVYASGTFVGWYNHHPDRSHIDLAGVETAVVIGSGNVALDVARLLVKSDAEFAGSDLAPDVSASFAASEISRVYVVGRSPAEDMKFTSAEVLELAGLVRARPSLGYGGQLGALDGKAAVALHAVVAGADARKPVEIVFEFGLTPIAFEGNGRLERVRFAAADGREVVRAARLAVTCIGYESHGHALERANGALRNVDGRIDAGLYAVGWAKRGPSGTIPTNRAEAQLVAKTILAQTSDATAKPGSAALVATLAARTARYVDYAAWRRIDASEVERASGGRARHKWRTLDELHAAARV